MNSVPFSTSGVQVVALTIFLGSRFLRPPPWGARARADAVCFASDIWTLLSSRAAMGWRSRCAQLRRLFFKTHFELIHLLVKIAFGAMGFVSTLMLEPTTPKSMVQSARWMWLPVRCRSLKTLTLCRVTRVTRGSTHNVTSPCLVNAPCQQLTCATVQHARGNER